MRPESISEGIYTWSFHDRIAIRSKKMHEVTMCKQALNELNKKTHNLLVLISLTNPSLNELTELQVIIYF